MKAKSLTLTLITTALVAAGVVVAVARTGGGDGTSLARLARGHAQSVGGVTALRADAPVSAGSPSGKPTALPTTEAAAKSGKQPRVVFAFAHPFKIPANNGRFVRLACPKKSIAMNYQEATRARDVFVDYSAVSPGSPRKWDVGFENLNSRGKAVVKAGVVCGKDL